MHSWHQSWEGSRRWSREFRWASRADSVGGDHLQHPSSFLSRVNDSLAFLSFLHINARHYRPCRQWTRNIGERMIGSHDAASEAKEMNNWSIWSAMDLVFSFRSIYFSFDTRRKQSMTTLTFAFYKLQMMIFQLNFFVNQFQFNVIYFDLISEHLFTFSFLSIPLIGKRGNVVFDLKFGPCFIERLGHFYFLLQQFLRIRITGHGRIPNYRIYKRRKLLVIRSPDTTVWCPVLSFLFSLVLHSSLHSTKNWSDSLVRTNCLYARPIIFLLSFSFLVWC